MKDFVKKSISLGLWYMRKNKYFGYGVPEINNQCFRGFEPRVHEFFQGGKGYVRVYY